MKQQEVTSTNTPPTFRQFDLKGVKLCVMKLFTLGNVDTWIAWPSEHFAPHYGCSMFEALGALVVKLANEDPKKR